MFSKLEEVFKHYQKLEEQLQDPSLYSDNLLLKKISQEKASLDELIEIYLLYKKKEQAFTEAKKSLEEEKEEELRSLFKEEIKILEPELSLLEEKLKQLLIPKDPLDQKDIYLEIRAGAGGVEASLFVQEIARMYQNYIKKKNYKFELVSFSEGEEGLREIILHIKGLGAYGLLRYESGVHRVQRVPKTETLGRIHTSTITIAVMPEADEIDFKLDLNDVRIDVYRASGNGGQSVNTTDSAVRVTHIPTNIVVAIQDEKSQLKNKDKALKILTQKIYNNKIEEARLKEANERKNLVGTADRSERIRTYNFPQGRVTDHRINLTLYSLESILEGDLDELTNALISHYQAEKLQHSE